MKLNAVILTAGLAFGVAAYVSDTGWAHGDDHEHNLKVLKDNGKDLERGMKRLAKGLGVKCKACHVKGDFAKDDKKEKEHARTFFGSVVSESDKAKKEAALQDLLKAMSIKAPKNAKMLWDGVSKLEKK